MAIARHERIPVRTIATTIGMVLATALLLLLIWELRPILLWMLIAAFFAVALYPFVNMVEKRFAGGRRWLATLIVYLVVTAALLGLVALFVVPLAREGTTFAQQLPEYVEQARTGRGPVGNLLERFNVVDFINRNQDRIGEAVSQLGTPALHVVGVAAHAVAAVVTIFVLSYLMVLESPVIVKGVQAILPERHLRRVSRVGADCARAVTGYLTGSLLIATIAGTSTFLLMLALGVPYPGLIAVFVAITDLIPLVGATMGAVVAVLFAFVESVPAGIIAIVFFVIYQQVENHVFQPVIMSRTVQLNPLTVLVAILFGVQLLGILGALLAVPAAGVLQVIVRDLWDAGRGRLKEEPTVGEDETPAGRPAT